MRSAVSLAQVQPLQVAARIELKATVKQTHLLS